ncbi:sensor histidine kinase [Clostridium peptidivorans]|uniref:sensor histidine kinase n=1 Tax=Clostridium peptidivorans TaxID=100174 RepID=UPI0015C69E05|nr:ATP-binding protein [Clostridium peptidivorans]
MKFLNKVSIRMRITLLTGAILLGTSIILTFSSMYNAHDTFMPLYENNLTNSVESDKSPLIQNEDINKLQAGASEFKSTAAAATPAIEAKMQFELWSYIYLIIFSGIGMIVTYLVAGRALRPLKDLNISVSNIKDHNFKEKIPNLDVDDEISSLAKSFNAMLDRLNESFLHQKQFSARVAHELKTPLSIMNAGIQVLQLDNKPTIEDYEETIEMTERNLKRLMNIVDDLFMLTNESNTDFADEIDLKQLFLQIEAELQSLYNEKNIHITYELEFDKIEGNKTLIYRAFFNLFENAMKYNITNGKILIKTLVENNMRKVTIYDSGIGIPSEDINKVFEPFYRVDPSRSRKIAGAGLGLSIVKSIFEKHGWKIEVESTVDVETRFIVSAARHDSITGIYHP